MAENDEQLGVLHMQIWILCIIDSNISLTEKELFEPLYIFTKISTSVTTNGENINDYSFI